MWFLSPSVTANNSAYSRKSRVTFEERKYLTHVLKLTNEYLNLIDTTKPYLHRKKKKVKNNITIECAYYN